MANAMSNAGCPLCNQPVSAPPLDDVIARLRLKETEACILTAVWRGKGRPVQTERIFDAMYADDPEGGPSPGRMYAAFNAALGQLRRRLVGSGVAIESVGFRRGYRLSFR